jgi:dihydrodipicolinate synthase/N-acetylneuraminate lyase
MRRLTRETFVGPWAGLPVAWTEGGEVDEQTYRSDVARCCRAGVPGVYSGGTTGEFYAMELDEFRLIARATVEECHGQGKPAMIGCSSTYTLGAARRAGIAAEVGADAVQAALPFWMEVEDREVVTFFKEASAAAPGLPLSVYETPRAKKKLTFEQHLAIKDAVPDYLMVKATAGTIGTTPDGCRALSAFINVFVSETLWADLGPNGVRGSCSAMVYWNPRVVLALWEKLTAGDWPGLAADLRPVEELLHFLFERYGKKGFTDTAYDRLGGRASGFIKTSLRNRGPYISATEEDVRTLREWYREHFPEMLIL